MGSIGRVYFPTFSKAQTYLKGRKAQQIKSSNWEQLWTLHAQEIGAHNSGLADTDSKVVFDFTKKLNQLAVGNHPFFTITDQELDSKSIGCYEWASDIIRFDRRVIELSSGKPFEVAAHETRHRMVLHQLAFPFHDFSSFSEYISPLEVEMISIKVRQRYPRQAWEGELDAFVIGHVANKMHEAGHSLEDIAALVSSTSHPIPYFDSVLHMLVKIDPQPKYPIINFVTSDTKYRGEYLERSFGVKHYLLGILATRVRFPFSEKLSHLFHQLKTYFSNRLSLGSFSFRASFRPHC